MKNICCLRKDIIIAKKFCAASECIAGPSTVTAGYVGAEKGVERAHYLPPARGFGNMQPSRPQPRWQRSYLHVQCLALPPLPPSPGERHKGGRGDLQGMAPGALAHSYQRAQCPAPRAGSRVAADLPWAHRRPRSGTPSVRPQSEPPAGCPWRAGIV